MTTKTTRHDSIQAPSHVTKGQAHKILGVSPAVVTALSTLGGPLEPETWWGVEMIPMHKVTAYKDRLDEQLAKASALKRQKVMKRRQKP